jgi:hypothetical protein
LIFTGKCWMLSLVVHVAHADNVLRGLSAAADVVEAAPSSVGMPSHATAFFTRAKWAASVSAFPRVALEAPLVTSMCCVSIVAWELHVVSYVFCARCVHNVVLPFADSWIPLHYCHSCPHPYFHVLVTIMFLVIHRRLSTSGYLVYSYMRPHATETKHTMVWFPLLSIPLVAIDAGFLRIRPNIFGQGRHARQ